MKRIISLLFIMIISILLFNVTTMASEEKINYIISDSSIDFPIDDNHTFNFVYARENDILELEDRINNIANNYQIDDYKLNIRYTLNDKLDFIINVEIKNKVLKNIEYLFNEILFIRLRENGAVYIKYIDLREYGDLVSLDFNNVNYDIECEANISLDSKRMIYNDFINNIGFSYISGITFKEREIGFASYKGTEPKSIELIRIARTNNSHYEAFESEGNDYEVPNRPTGRYICKVYNFDYDGSFFITTIIVCVYNENSIICSNADISYKTFLSSKKYVNNYVGGYDDYFDKSKYIVQSTYFSNYNTIGSYPVTVKYTYEDHELVGRGTINVVDDIKPYFEGDSIFYGKLSSLEINASSIFSSIKAYDEIDGDLTERIKIQDLNDYRLNYDVPGEYNFILSVEDNTGNVATKNVKYILEDDINVNPEPEPEPELTEPEKPIENPINQEEKVEDNKQEEIIDNPIREDNPIIDEEEPISNPTEIEEEEANIEPKEEEKSEEANVISGMIRTTTDNKLSEDDLKRKLIFSGFIDDAFNGTIETEYYGNENSVGEYNIIISENDNVKTVKIMVTDSVNNAIVEPKNNTKVIVWVSIGALAIIGGILILVLIKRKKRLNN